MATQQALIDTQPETIEAVNGNGAIVPLNPMALLQIAVEKNLDVDKLEKLMALQERWEKREAEKAFVAAMNAFKQNPPVIEKNKHVKFNATEYDHATLDHVVEQVGQGLSKHGISHRWETKQTDKDIEVACILTHDLGHSERTILKGPADTSGSKNAIQAIGSTVTYLQRYTLLAATGLAAKGQDDDGVDNSSKLPDLKERLEYFAKCATIAEVDAHAKASWDEAKKVACNIARAAILKARDFRRSQLRAEAK